MTEVPEAGDVLVELDPTLSVRDRVFSTSSLVVIGTRRGDGYDLAPKHMAGPLGEGWYGFVCTPTHVTCHNAREAGEFTVSYPRPDQVVVASGVVGRIVSARAHPDALRTTGVDDEEGLRRLPVLAHLSPGRYAALDHGQVFPFPAGFQE